MSLSAEATVGADLGGGSRRWDTTAVRIALTALKWIGMYLAALVLFGCFAWLRGADPIAMYQAMWDWTVVTEFGRGQVLERAAPFVLAALAVAVPARAGIVNIGGEGQLVLGATAAGGVSLALGTALTGMPAILLMALAGMVAGALWAGLAAGLRLAWGVDEAISTLLLNYIAVDVLAYLVYGPWKDASGNGQPASKPLVDDSRLPDWGLISAHVGILVAVGATAVVAVVLSRSRFGFTLRAVGGNTEAARRAGLPVGLLLLAAMLFGGALAGLGGAVHYAGMEGQLRPGIAATFGYTAFLASWLARHHPVRVALAAVLLALIAVSGDALQIGAGLPKSAVHVLMALVLLAALAYRPTFFRRSA